MSIKIKKYTKDQMAKMVEDAQAEVQELKRVNAALTKQIDRMNDEAINKANEIANLKADADALRNKLADTEAALGRANDGLAFKGKVIDVMRDKRYNAEQRANYAEAHPWRNLWAWVKRKLGGE
jgi:predicted  nucleic acid-binding Zn-ribbon protein|nr:MAG TPA: coiled-coil domain-containing protein [Caudoviricetes sp.]